MITSNLEKLVQPLSYMNMDMTHIRMLYEILKFGKFHNVLEIGSYDGASAIAFIAALNDCHVSNVTFCDIAFQPRFKRVVSEALCIGGVTVSEERSIKVLEKENFDFVFVDGDHAFQNVREEVRLLLVTRVPNIAAHDTNSSAVGIAACEGAAYLKAVYTGMPEFLSVEDKAVRLNEQTERGFFFTSSNPELFAAVKSSVFKRTI